MASDNTNDNGVGVPEVVGGAVGGALVGAGALASYGANTLNEEKLKAPKQKVALKKLELNYVAKPSIEAYRKTLEQISPDMQGAVRIPGMLRDYEASLPVKVDIWERTGGAVLEAEAKAALATAEAELAHLSEHATKWSEAKGITGTLKKPLIAFNAASSMPVKIGLGALAAGSAIGIGWGANKMLRGGSHADQISARRTADGEKSR